MEKTRQLIDTAWMAWWESMPGGPPFPVEYHNQAARTPKEGVYGRMSIITGEAMPASVGQTHERFEAMLCLQIFLPEDTDFPNVTRAHDVMRAFWRYKQFSDTTDGIVTRLDFGNVSLVAAGARDGYKQYNAWANFRCDKYFPS